ncbi:MAG: Kelch repeat-containing protein, partial [Candidatus Hydrothermia bacterium]
DWLPVAYGATAVGVTRTNYWYDISGNAWQTRAQGPTPARYDCAGTFATLSGEKQLFVFAGSAGSYPADNTAFRYRYSTNAWTQIANFPYQAEGVMAAGEIAGMIYTFGGHNAPGNWPPSTVTTNTYRYSPSGNSYTVRTAMPVARSEAGCAIARNENGDSCIYIISGIYSFDGFTGEPYYTSRTDEYNPGSNSWRNRANFPGTPVSGASAATLRNKIYVMGGYNYWSGANPTAIYIYNPATNTWVSGAAHTPPVPDLPGGRDGGVATAPDFPLQRVNLIRPVNGDTCCNDTIFWRRGTGAVKIVFATGGDAANNVYTTTWRLRSVVQGYVLKYDTLPNLATASV